MLLSKGSTRYPVQLNANEVDSMDDLKQSRNVRRSLGLVHFEAGLAVIAFFRFRSLLFQIIHGHENIDL